MEKVLEKVEKKRGRRPAVPRPTEEVLANLYSNHTSREIAEKYGVSDSTVKGWIYYYRHRAQG